MTESKGRVFEALALVSEAVERGTWPPIDKKMTAPNWRPQLLLDVERLRAGAGADPTLEKLLLPASTCAVLRALHEQPDASVHILFERACKLFCEPAESADSTSPTSSPTKPSSPPPSPP